ncbi:MAG: hypothetical protein ACOC70_00675 [bacterium]
MRRSTRTRRRGVALLLVLFVVVILGMLLANNGTTTVRLIRFLDEAERQQVERVGGHPQRGAAAAARPARPAPGGATAESDIP